MTQCRLNVSGVWLSFIGTLKNYQNQKLLIDSLFKYMRLSVDSITFITLSVLAIVTKQNFFHLFKICPCLRPSVYVNMIPIRIFMSPLRVFMKA